MSAEPLKLNEGSPGLRVGIDIGGTGIRFVALDAGNHVLARLAAATPGAFTNGTAAEFLADHIGGLAPGRTLEAIGIGASGPVDTDGIIRNPDTLLSFTGEPIVASLEGAFGVPVAIDNDAVCAALAEQRVGAAKNSRSLLHVTLGTGIGACMLIDGKPLRGGDGMHPETGHITVAAAATPACYCGREACWEQTASRQTLQRSAAALLGKGPTDRTAIAELAARARRGEKQATEVFRDYGLAIADGLGTLLAAYRPENVVLGGSAAQHFDLYSDTVERSLQRLGAWIHYAQISKTGLDDYGGAIGAAFLHVPMA
ncbi:ROK family protein [Arthrobacter sp. UYCu712]|uniref:ROK family protein n=1 Tax=Arthrobacter sp. UYCu712 TaxID=3156340 RepID=UPI003399375F